jgi:hypothetical protein
MKPFTFNRKLKRTTRHKYFHQIVHQKQGDKKNWCWAASSLMLMPSKHWNQDMLVRHVFSPGVSRTCRAKDCGVHIRQTDLATDDLPLCQDCNLWMLNDRSTPAWPFDSTGQLSFHEVCNAVGYRPIEAYVSPGPTAHYLVIHGVFTYFDRHRPHYFVMLADPMEEGPGFCEYGSFVENGAYHSTSRFYKWTNTFM